MNNEMFGIKEDLISDLAKLNAFLSKNQSEIEQTKLAEIIQVTDELENSMRVIFREDDQFDQQISLVEEETNKQNNLIIERNRKLNKQRGIEEDKSDDEELTYNVE